MRVRRESLSVKKTWGLFGYQHPPKTYVSRGLSLFFHGFWRLMVFIAGWSDRRWNRIPGNLELWFLLKPPRSSIAAGTPESRREGFLGKTTVAVNFHHFYFTLKTQPELPKIMVFSYVFQVLQIAVFLIFWSFSRHMKISLFSQSIWIVQPKIIHPDFSTHGSCIWDSIGISRKGPPILWFSDPTPNTIFSGDWGGGPIRCWSISIIIQLSWVGCQNRCLDKQMTLVLLGGLIFKN